MSKNLTPKVDQLSKHHLKDRDFNLSPEKPQLREDRCIPKVLAMMKIGVRWMLKFICL